MVGAATIRPAQIASVARIGLVQAVVPAVTFVQTVLVPLQHAVLVGVGLAVILQPVRLTLVQIHLDPLGGVRESTPVAEVPATTVVVLQPYGCIFFASAASRATRLPTVTPNSGGSVVTLRLRGVEDAGATIVEVLNRYAGELHDVGSRLVLVANSPRLLQQLHVGRVLAAFGEQNIYRANQWVGRTLRRAHRQASSSCGSKPDCSSPTQITSETASWPPSAPRPVPWSSQASRPSTRQSRSPGPRRAAGANSFGRDKCRPGNLPPERPRLGSR